MSASRKREAKPSHAKVTDCRNHVLVVFDGADRVGSLVERAGGFEAFDLAGRHLGAFADLRAAVRAIPPVASFSRQGKHVHGAVDLQRDRSCPSPAFNRAWQKSRARGA